MFVTSQGHLDEFLMKFAAFFDWPGRIFCSPVEGELKSL